MASAHEVAASQAVNSPAAKQVSAIAPTRSDFIYAFDGCDLSKEMYSVDFDNKRTKSFLKQFDVEFAGLLAYYIIRPFVGPYKIVLFTNRGCHIAIKKERQFFRYNEIKSVRNDLIVHLKDGRTIEIPKLPRSNKLVNLLNSLETPEKYGALRADVQEAERRYKPYIPPAVITGILVGAIVLHLTGDLPGIVVSAGATLIVALIVAKIVSVVVGKAMAAAREPASESENSAASTESSDSRGKD